MKICRRCGREYDEHDHDNNNPAQTLGKLYWDNADTEGEDALCPACREEIGILNLLGFGQ